MVRPFNSQDAGPPCGPSRQFQRGIDGFGSRIQKIHPVQILGQCCAEKRARPRLGFLHKLPVHHGVQVLVQLCLQLIVDRGVAMAKIAHPNAADRVKQLGAVGQMNPRSTGFCHLKAQGVQGR